MASRTATLPRLLTVCVLSLAAAASISAFGGFGTGEAWADDGSAAADTPQLSVTASVAMTATLDPASGKIDVADGAVSNNGCDVVMESAAFNGADGVAGTWTAGIGGAKVVLPSDGSSRNFSSCEMARGENKALTLSTTFGSFAAGKMVGKSLGTLALTFAPKVEAFAVYSADDQSLTFYKRGGKPKAGDVLCGKTVTEVYEGFEEEEYGRVDENGALVDLDTPWLDKSTEIVTVSAIDEGIAPASLQGWFQGFSKLKTATLAKLDLSKCTSLFCTFYDCRLLTDIDELSNWDVSNVVRMNGTFGYCASLKSLKPLSSWNTSSLSVLASTFAGCSSIENLTGLESWDTSRVYSMDRLFAQCSELASAGGVEDWDVSNCTWFAYLFSYCYNLTELNLSTWNVDKSTTFHLAFEGMNRLQTVSLPASWKWVGTGCYLPTPSADYIENADGKWYDAATGVGYAPADVPGGVAATYVAADPKTAFAVYSDDDKSLDFYKRMSVPNVGDMFNGKAVTAVYTGFETDEYATRADVPWADHKSNIVTVEAVDEVRPKSMARWFDMGDVKDSSGNYNSPLQVAKLGKVDTSRCTSFRALFQVAVSLTNVEGVGFWNTSKVADMSYMFYGCSGLTSLDVSKWDTSSFNSSRAAFYSCSSLASLDVSKWKTGKITNMAYMFCGCPSLTSLDVSGWDTSKVANMSYMFYGCSGLTGLDVSKWDTSACTTMKALYGGCPSLTSLDVSGWDTCKVTDMSNMFYGCSGLTGLDVSKWNTSACTTTLNMFWLCTGLTSLDVSNWDTSSLQNTFGMFAAYGNDYMRLKTIGDLSGWDTSHITDMSWMFQDCEYLESIGDISGWDVSNANVEGLFNRCVRLDGIGDLSDWDVSKTTSFDSMFRGQGMTKVGMEMDVSFVKSWNVSNATKFDEMFEDCDKQAELDLSGWDFSKAASASNMFSGTGALEKVSLPTSWKWLDGGRLGTPDASAITGADGKWHTKDGASYAPAEIPDGAGTYYAVPKQAFAVYSADDGSLNFYNRAGMPSAGEQFAGKTATAVYTGIESEEYGSTDSSDNDTSTTTPWWSVHEGIASVEAIDGFKPKSLAFWFQYLTNCKRFDLSKIDTSSVTSLQHAFSYCSAATTVNLSGWDVSRVRIMDSTFKHMYALEKLDLSGWTTPNLDNLHITFQSCTSLKDLTLGDGGNASKVYDAIGTFAGDGKLSLDCSEWDVSLANEKHADFNLNSPGVTLPKAWQPTAFAIYSDDDKSLDFYKRERWQMPSDGGSWEGKAATEVYTGIETDMYDRTAGWYGDVNTPWYGQRENILSVSVADGGITPKSFRYYFQNLSNVRSIDISKFNPTSSASLFHLCAGCTKLTDVKLNVERPTTIDSAFTDCSALESVDLTSLNLESLEIAAYTFEGCSSLKEIKGVESIGASNPWRFEELFYGCSSLESLDLSGWKTSSNAGSDYQYSERMFDDCSSLHVVKFGDGWKWNTSGAGRLPAQSFTGADGKWYAEDGTGYAPADIPDGAGTYYAEKLAGTVSVSGNAAVGGALTANVSGMQGDVEPQYEWVRTKEETKSEHIEFTGKTVTRTIEVTNAPATLKFENVGPLSSTQSADDEYGVSVQIPTLDHYCYERVTAPNGDALSEKLIANNSTYSDIGISLKTNGSYSVSLYSLSPDDDDIDLAETCSFDLTLIEARTIETVGSETTYPPIADDLGNTLTCRVSDKRGLYLGAIESETQTVGKGTITPVVKLSGTGVNGDPVCCNVTGLSDVGKNDISYHWYCSSVADFSVNVQDLQDYNQNHGTFRGAGKYYRCVASVSGNDYFDYVTVESDVFGPLSKGVGPTPTLSISGDTKIGSVLSCGVTYPQKYVDYGDCKPSKASYQWQWKKEDGSWQNSTNPGAATANMTIGPDCGIGAVYRCVVTTNSTQYDCPIAYSNESDPVYKDNTNQSGDLPATTADAATWTLAQQKAVAEDISANGTDSKWYARAKAAMDSDVNWKVDLTDGTTLTYRIIGILHDDKSDGSGKAGLTFQAVHSLAKAYAMNAEDTNTGGWEASELRASMNSGEIWNLLPSELQGSIASVSKMTNNVDGDASSVDVLTATIDKLFLLSLSEYVPINDRLSIKYPWTAQEGSQYEYWDGKVTDNNAANNCLANLWKTAKGETPSNTEDTRA